MDDPGWGRIVLRPRSPGKGRGAGVLSPGRPAREGLDRILASLMNPPAPRFAHFRPLKPPERPGSASLPPYGVGTPQGKAPAPERRGSLSGRCGLLLVLGGHRL